MTDPNSPSTSYKDSLELVTSKSSNDPEQELTFVNPCYAAPTPFTELQPFSSRQSQSHGKLFMKAMRRVIEMVKYSWMREGRRG
jgi:hypothetical protein